MPKKSHRNGLLLAAPALLILVGLVFLPLLSLSLVAFAKRGPYGTLEFTWTIENLTRLFGFGIFGWSNDMLLIFVRSIALALVTTASCLLLAFPLAFWLKQKSQNFRTIGVALLMIPSCVNLVIRTYGWTLLLGPSLPFSRAAQWAGLLDEGAALSPGSLAVSLGMTSAMLPFCALPIITAVERLDDSLLDAARDLYAGPFQVFRHAVLPQLSEGLVAAITLTLVPSLGMFLVSDLLGGAKEALLGNLIQQQFGSAADAPFGAALGASLVLSSLAALVAMRRFRGGLWPDEGS